jgi:hypothetical protein
MTKHVSRSNWDQLKTVEGVQEQIDLRAKLSDEMVGTLYPSIIRDEVCDLLDLKKVCDNGSKEGQMHLETTWLLQLLEDDHPGARMIAVVVRHKLDEPPRWISRKGELWCLNEQHINPDMARRATYLMYGKVDPWEFWSND